MKQRKREREVFSNISIRGLLLAALLGISAAALSGCAGAQSGRNAGNVQDGGTAQDTAEEEGTRVAYLGDEAVYLDEALFYTRMLQEQWE